MTPATIIETACREGVMLFLSTAGTIKATGNGAVVNRWLPMLRERKAEIIGVLKHGNSKPFTPTIRQSSPSLIFGEEMTIRTWLALIGETDPVTMAEVIDSCRRDADAREYFVRRAAVELPKSAPFPDDRRTCSQCANLIARRCQAAKRGEIVASRNYEPIRDIPRRCEGYVPGADDSDRRLGRERWPNL